MMNQSLINELRALEVSCRMEYNKLSDEEKNDLLVAQLLLARSNCLNGIAVLVAANKVAR